MFDIGFLELIIVAIIALLVLGPERLPVAARSVGRWVGKARSMVSKFSKEIDRQIEIDELREQLKKQGESLNINDDAKKIHQTINDALAKVNSDIEKASDTTSDISTIPTDTSAPKEASTEAGKQ